MIVKYDASVSEFAVDSEYEFAYVVNEWVSNGGITLPTECPWCGTDDIDFAYNNKAVLVWCNTDGCPWVGKTVATLDDLLNDDDFYNFVRESDSWVLYLTDGDGF